ncbi:hypothetical protein B6U98_02675 [Thermoplasmatales archaeon ex4572_165]|nr:MAG: hypothetical protein B6U98_02675 [Thermoplasmatales archaeon ex4572_165]RLF60178.1 MAG: hypothetical protein DRN27_00430 [Thermoplasmata archaeon]
MNTFTKKIVLTISFDSEKQSCIIAGSLKPEMQKDIPHVKIVLKQNKEKIILEFSAMQTNVLRAAINSYVRWIETAYSINCI